MNDQSVLAAVLRSDLRSFIWKCFQTILPGTPYLRNWHVDAIVHQLMRVQAGEISRLLINQPPRSLKSICVSVAYVAWLLGHDPTRRIIIVSYSNEFAAELCSVDPTRLIGLGMVVYWAGKSRHRPAQGFEAGTLEE